MPDEHQVSQAARDFNPPIDRDARAARRRSELSDRVRILAAGILAVVWGLFVGESKGPNISDARVQLLWAAGLTVFALLLDYLESFLGYTSAKVRWGNWLRHGVDAMFFAKQIGTIAAAIALSVGAYRLLNVPRVTAQMRYTYWEGYTVDDADQTHERHTSEVCISEPDPTTRRVVAAKDRLHCDGIFNNATLRLDCEQGLTLSGTVAERSSYSGTWTASEAVGTSTGTFQYSYVQDDACSAVSRK